ncbi:MAG: TPM domain-containing protein [Bacteroidota bacterium]
MKKLKFLLPFLSLLIYTLSLAQDLPERPRPPKLVNDFANILNRGEQTALEKKLVTYHDTTSTQIVVVTINSLKGNDISDYSFRLGEKWGIGQKGKDNGVLILVALNDRKMFIAAGYGMEDIITDALAKRIVESYMKPDFRSNNYYGGIDKATTIIMNLASGRYSGEGAGRRKRSPVSILFPLLLVILIIFMSYSRFKKARGSQIGGSNLGFWAFLMLMSASSGGRSGFGSFSSGGGSFGGGGFSGFGGGSFGGGGAGGSW